MEGCIFCKIVKGESPSYKVYEDELFFGFLDRRPRLFGHTLMIPKKHYKWVYEIQEFAAYWLAIQKATFAIQKVLNPTFVSYLTYGMHVAHAHVHILPRKKEELGIFPPIKPISLEEMKVLSERIKQALVGN